MNDMWSCQVVTYRKQKTKEYIKCLALNSIWLREKKQLFGHLQEGLITRSGHYERVDWMLGVPHTDYHYM